MVAPLKGYMEVNYYLVGKDENNQMFPIAYVVVEAETKGSWEWFLDLLLKDLNDM